MHMTLLEMVQSILSDMDSEDVNSISDTVEAEQIASVVRDTYYNIVAGREFPEHEQLLKLTALSDSNYPTHMRLPDTVRRIDKVWYNVSTDGGIEFRELRWIDPDSFLTLRAEGSNTTQISDKNSGSIYLVGNDAMPTYYTSFDNYYIVMDSHDSTVDTTLQASKSRCRGLIYPEFTLTDSFTPDLDMNWFPYLLAEAKSACFSIFKSGTDPKVDQAARRLKSYLQNDRYRTKQENKRPKYGRR